VGQYSSSARGVCSLLLTAKSRVRFEGSVCETCGQISKRIPHILETNPHPFYSFRGLKNQMRIRIACGLDSRS